jgi:hypothetical protein
MQPYSYRNFEYDTNSLYAHLLELRKQHPPEQIINLLKSLLNDFDPSESSSLNALKRVIASEWAEREFPYFLNRCCYILINYWWLHPDSRVATADLVNLLQRVPETSAYSPVTRKLRILVQQFTQTEQFQALVERVKVISAPVTAVAETEPISNLTHRYPYLYPHRLLDWDSTELGPNAIRRLQQEKESQFERQLQQYAIATFRQTSHAATKEEIPNPTLLADLQLDTALQSFAGVSEGLEGYRQSAQHFLEVVPQAKTFREVKQLLYHYLTDSIRHSCNPRYGDHSFNNWLREQLDRILPQRDNDSPTIDLLVQTCDRLIDTLVANPNRQRNHWVFIDLNMNLGATFTIGFILKLVLVCCLAKPKVQDTIQSRLAGRVAVLVKHYENHIRSDMKWLVECLENWLLARTIHFGENGVHRWASLFQR